MTNEFASYKFHEYLNQALQALRFEKPTPVQKRVIPLALQGKNIVAQSATGSGKTHAYLLPIFQNLDVKKNQVQAVITTPSRELGYQLYDNAKQLAQHCDGVIHLANYIGGTDEKRQLEKLEHLQPQIIVGTPGRINDLIAQKALNVNTAKTFVIDEADMTLDMGFLPQIQQITKALSSDVQTMVFSATIPQNLKQFLRKNMDHPKFVKIPVKSVINPNVKNLLINVHGQNRGDLIYKLVTMGQPYLVLIFANTRDRVIDLTEYLKGKGLKVAMIEGGMQPRRRKRMMRQIRDLKYQYVVCTDLAARGLDIPGVSLVINDQIPRDLRYFIHRVGRTGRNHTPGTAITLFESNDVKGVRAVEKLGVKFQPRKLVNGELVAVKERTRRHNRQHGSEHISPFMKGYVHKAKQHVRPGYKKKIKKHLLHNAAFNRRTYNRKKYE